MEIEKGDLFCVTRGFELNSEGFPGFGSLLGMPSYEPPASTKTKRHDRSHEGRVYRALEVCGVHIAARVVAATGFELDREKLIGSVISLNTSEVELMTVTPAYFAAITHPSDGSK